MPHVTVHYTANLDRLDPDALLAAINRALLDSGEFGVLAIKSRAIRLDHFRIGETGADHAFVHASLKILPGRPLALRQAITASVLAAMQAAAPHALHCQFCVELEMLDAETYTKAEIDGRPAPEPAP